MQVLATLLLTFLRIERLGSRRIGGLKSSFRCAGRWTGIFHANISCGFVPRLPDQYQGRPLQNAQVHRWGLAAQRLQVADVPGLRGDRDGEDGFDRLLCLPGLGLDSDLVLRFPACRGQLAENCRR
jgi:hypothetical protein